MIRRTLQSMRLHCCVQQTIQLQPGYDPFTQSANANASNANGNANATLEHFFCHSKKAQLERRQPSTAFEAALFLTVRDNIWSREIMAQVESDT